MILASSVRTGGKGIVLKTHTLISGFRKKQDQDICSYDDIKAR
jgi:hypothetical protein